MFSIADLIPRSVIQALGPSPTDEFWYQPAANPVSSAGVRITPERAMTISTVFRCVAAISGDVAAMPLKIYERQTDGGKREARNHPLYDVLHDQPNSWQTSFEWREMMQSHALMRGNGYSL
ncbi:MAG TPA: phage portal protein, partial [Dehalococcoidia bacterium]|nr:phage portal protein [Dehalococcoidia bacterium]